MDKRNIVGEMANSVLNFLFFPIRLLFTSSSIFHHMRATA
jgi:hypothetical protein